MTKSTRKAAPAQADAPLEFHPFADVFPLMKGKEFDELVADIKKNGQHDPIVLFKGKILDGRNRYRACLAAGIKPETIKGDLWVGDPRAYVISVNARRRHLKPADKRKAIKTLLKANPEKPDLQIAKTVNASPSTVGKVRTEMETKGDVSKVETRKDTKGRRQVARKPRRSNRATKRGHNATSPAAATTSATPATTSAAPATTSAAPAPATTTVPASSPTTAPPANTDAAETKPSYRELEIQLQGCKSEIEELKAARTLPALVVMLTEQLRHESMPERVKAVRWLIEKTGITPNDVLEQAVETVADAPGVTAPDSAAATEPSEDETSDKWQIKTKKYVKGWSWFATNGTMNLNSKPGVLFATEEEARADARAAIARYEQEAAAA